MTDEKIEKRLLGAIMLRQRSITKEDLDRGLLAQAAAQGHKKPIASQLTELGVLSETGALRALSEQFGVPGIDLTQVAILLSQLDLVPREVALANRILPVLAREDRLFLAMANPRDRRVIDELEFVSGRKIYPYVAISSTLDRATLAAYDAKARGETYYLAPNVPDSTLIQLGLKGAERTEAAAPSSPQISAKTPNKLPRSPLTGQMPAIDKRGDAAKPLGPAPNMATPFDSGSLNVNTKETIRPKQVEALGPGGYAHVLDDAARREGEQTRARSEGENVDFDISIPGSARPIARENEPKFTIPEGPGSLVLIVDDEEDIRKLLTRLVTSKGYRAMEADRGLTALRAVKEHPPDLIILDAMLPEVHGFDIARRIRNSEKYNSIPIIMISGVYKGWRIVEDLKTNYGIDEYIEKPFAIADITDAIARALSRAKESAPRNPDEISRDAEALLAEGVEAYKDGNIEGAIDALQRGIKIDPLAYRLRYHLALLYGKCGQVYEGISELERAVELNPKHFPALKNLAILYEKAGFKHKAIEMWERCVQTAPEMETRLSIKEHLLRLL